MRRALLIAALMGALGANAGVTMVGKVPVITGTSAPQFSGGRIGSAPICLWQAPGFLAWHNLYNITEISVSKASNGLSWNTLIKFDRRYLTFEFHKEPMSIVDAINSRLAECKAG